MAVQSQATLTVHCALKENPLHFELALSSLDQQDQLLRLLSDAYTGFLKELTPDDSALAETVKIGIEGMAQLRQRLRMPAEKCAAPGQASEKSKDSMEAECRIASKATTALVEEGIKRESERCSSLGEGDPLPPRRSVAFRLGAIEKEREDHGSCEEEVYSPPARSQVVTPNDVDLSLQRFFRSLREDSESDEDLSENPCDFHSMVPSGRQKASRTIPSRLRAAFREVRLPCLRASRRSGQVRPEPAE
eukprot:TRINITY_DN84888_c0_g1_i1.p1 TRINITY_DN84888_c0_g1~~TRINITY_DN84888_c0_g1_i1.p1  ORF type:complete len:248 (+),score=54.89 TRINITY_DN84888_c0_g1_i1:51-794(+)